MFNYDRVATSAGWIREIERQATMEEEEEAKDDHDHNEEHHEKEGDEHQNEENEHDHHHHHDEEGGEVEEYGISTFTYYRRPAFDLNKFDYFIAKKWPKNVIRAKGIMYFKDEPDMSYIFEQAGIQKKLSQAGQWYATAPEEDLIKLMQQDPGFMRDWDEKYGDRMVKLVFIGQNLDKDTLTKDLDACLE